MITASNSVNMETLSLDEREAIISRFSEKVGNALLKSPPKKHFVRNALCRKDSPKCITRILRLSLDGIIRYGDDLANFFCEYPDNILSPHPYDIFVGQRQSGAVLSGTALFY